MPFDEFSIDEGFHQDNVCLHQSILKESRMCHCIHKCIQLLEIHLTGLLRTLNEMRAAKPFQPFFAFTSVATWHLLKATALSINLRGARTAHGVPLLSLSKMGVLQS